MDYISNGLMVISPSKVNRDEFTLFTSATKGLNSDHLISTLLSWHDSDKQAMLLNWQNQIFGLVGLDYETNLKFITITGNTELYNHALAQSFLAFAEENDCKQFLFLGENVANTVAGAVNREYQKMPSSNSDYIYECGEQTLLAGSKFQTRRRTHRLFEKIYDNQYELRIMEGTDALKHPEVISLFDDWQAFGTEGSSDNKAEEIAFSNYINSDVIARFADTVTLELFIKNKLVAFVALERIGNFAATCHFQKCNLNISHANDFFFWQINKFLFGENRHLYNFQEDADIAGLANYKQRLRPYIIESKFEIKIS